MEETKSKSGILGLMSPGQVFALGLGGGIMVLCTLGFLILLPSVLKGGLLGNSNNRPSSDIDTVDSNQVGNAGSGPKLSDVAKAVGLDYEKFKSCVSAQKYASKISADETEAQAAGAQGTPYTVIIGPKGETVPIKGAYPFAVLDGVIKNMLGQKVDAANLPPVEKVKIRAADGSKEPIRGKASAKITLVEYSDLECPFCKQFHKTMEQVIQAYPNDVKWVYRHMPLDSLHSKARTEANATECAGEQGKFWEFTDSIFKVTPSNDGMDITLS